MPSTFGLLPEGKRVRFLPHLPGPERCLACQRKPPLSPSSHGALQNAAEDFGGLNGGWRDGVLRGRGGVWTPRLVAGSEDDGGALPNDVKKRGEAVTDDGRGAPAAKARCG